MSFFKIIRSVASVVVGYSLFAVPTFLLFRLAQPPHQEAPLGFMAVTALVGVCFSFLGGYVSGLLAGTKPLGYAIGVAVVVLLGASVSLASTIGKGAIWSQVIAITLIAPSAVLGGWVRSRHHKNLA
jgi:hypothetical protein